MCEVVSSNSGKWSVYISCSVQQGSGNLSPQLFLSLLACLLHQAPLLQVLGTGEILGDAGRVIGLGLHSSSCYS